MCVLSQGYTNADNPFGDQHLLDKFVWSKVTSSLFIDLLTQPETSLL